MNVTRRFVEPLLGDIRRAKLLRRLGRMRPGAGYGGDMSQPARTRRSIESSPSSRWDAGAGSSRDDGPSLVRSAARTQSVRASALVPVPADRGGTLAGRRLAGLGADGRVRGQSTLRKARCISAGEATARAGTVSRG